mmetsp:Transcript_112128/g.317863  ORF Transcript_112128/g.317863 Transcript_112128/m.317863 type:complete len:202 (-) Transcript_112128:148-753(-)
MPAGRRRRSDWAVAEASADRAVWGRRPARRLVRRARRLGVPVGSLPACVHRRAGEPGGARVRRRHRPHLRDWTLRRSLRRAPPRLRAARRLRRRRARVGLLGRLGALGAGSCSAVGPAPVGLPQPQRLDLRGGARPAPRGRTAARAPRRRGERGEGSLLVPGRSPGVLRPLHRQARVRRLGRVVPVAPWAPPPGPRHGREA